jgi:two-component system invasion response regulator UvrY
MKLLVVDDHAVVRRGLKQIISELPEVNIIDEAANGAEAIKLVRKNVYDLVLLDISMPDKSGLEVLKILKAEYPELKLLMLSVYPEDQYAMRVLKAGAAGYLTKESAPDELQKAIKKVVGGGKYVSPSLAEKLAETISGEGKVLPHDSLSDREYQVMVMIATGKTVTEIADKLSLSVKTISTYRTRILEKMNFKSNAELIRYAIRNGLVA